MPLAWLLQVTNRPEVMENPSAFGLRTLRACNAPANPRQRPAPGEPGTRLGLRLRLRPGLIRRSWTRPSGPERPQEARRGAGRRQAPGEPGTSLGLRLGRVVRSARCATFTQRAIMGERYLPLPLAGGPSGEPAGETSFPSAAPRHS